MVTTIDGASDAVPAVLCIGEAMVAFSPVGGSLVDSDRVQPFVAGAEANVAAGLAHLGQAVEWFGRVGDDPFGERIRASLRERGVDASRVIVDPSRPTGLYFKDRRGSASTMHYYRSGSAASALSVDDIDGLALGERQLVHLSGITPALSPACDAFVEEVLRRIGRRSVSFDVNYRAKLWPVEVAAPRILALARQARIVLTGRDEAEELWGAATPEAIRRLFPDAEALVIKDSDVGATEFRGAAEVFVPAPRVEVIEPIGAGDAFAAGYLSAFLGGDTGETCVKLGHVMAAHALRNTSDSPIPPGIALLREMAARAGDNWNRVAFTGRVATKA
jgi:2-dehydro-3-deoxygluconokinase